MEQRVSVRELANLDAAQVAVFRKAFNANPPDVPRHFMAWLVAQGGERPAAYVHYRPFETGVYLCGGLCVDTSIYRLMNAGLRNELASEGNLSRWILRTSIAGLGQKRAVFGYTGNTRSRRDAFALGFVPAGQFLIVQWHDETAGSRAALVDRVTRKGPF